MKIVVVDDQEDILIMIRMVLTNLGYEVVTDQTGELVLKMNHENTGLIILDINIGVRDGRTICRELKVNRNTKEIPVIFASSETNLDYDSAISGADGFLPKPFSINELKNIVQKHLLAA